MMQDKDYNKYLGLKMLGQLNLYAGFKNNIDAEFLGECIKTHKHVVVTYEIINKEKVWVIKEASEAIIKKAWGHGYLITGKHFRKIGESRNVVSGPSADCITPLKKGESEKRKVEAERDTNIFDRKLEKFSSDNNNVSWIRNKIQKIENEKEIIEKVEKGIIPKAKIIYTPMGNDKRRK